jgi:eukaryotic-like serine/threonine-protein kinase
VSDLKVASAGQMEYNGRRSPMTPARFQTIEEIFLAALEQEPDQISAFLDTACDGDDALRREVEVLLASDQKAGRFIESSAVGLATNIIQNQQTDSLVGQTIGHYKISESIGAGGMGEVYLATDIIAGRRAALKLVPFRFTGDAERLKRFQQEAHAVVGLNHPNIVTVYEIGEDYSIHYIASELIEGETLRDRLTRGSMQLSEAVDVAIQIASALAAAHRAGIVHRDIKPENIMLRPDGYVKVLDFGIAKLAEQEVPVTTPRDEALLLIETNLGSILGTVRYMSPEQACGAPVDKRTDIWSLGVVLYEMATGQAPFTGDKPREVMSAILEKEPPPLTRYITHPPAELQQIISKTLRKDRKERYHSAHELLESLKGLRHKLEVEAELQPSTATPSWLHWKRSPTALVLGLLVAAMAVAVPFYWHRNLTTSSPPEKSIAVLPFENLSRDPDNAYFADGIQEEILTRLASIADLKVISRTSTQRYQSKPRNLREIAKQLGVANILEGSVQKAADQVRVNVQLVNAHTDSHLWADSYDRKLTDIFGVESEIAKGIAESLQAKLTGREEQVLAVKPTHNPEAYDAYLRGLAFEGRSSSSYGSYSPDLVGQAAGSFERAVQLDPNFALAWARLSHANAHLYFSGGLQSTSAARDTAKRALDNAQRLEPNSPETLLALGYYQYYVLGDYGLAKSTFRLVSKMLPGSSEVPYALGRVARREGNWDESIAYFEQALTLEPRYAELLMELAETYGLVRQFPAALKLYDRVLDIKPNDLVVMAEKASIYQAQGNLQEAATFLSEINEQTPDELTFDTKISQLRLERNYGEAVRLLQARLAQFHFDSQDEKAVYQVALALTQRLAGDTAGAKATAEQSRDILEPLYRDESRSQKARAHYAADLSQAYAAMGEKDLALKTAAHAIMLWPRTKDPKVGPVFEENLAIIQTIFGENSRAISTLTQLLQTSYSGRITPALLRLDPLWDPIRNDPRFQELVAENAPLPEKSIAVLPFENLSNDEENAFFAGGVQDEILTDLAKIADLKVISRTSVMQYKTGSERNVREIAKTLGVSHVVEGSVQRAGGRIRVSAQLIDARTDNHLWAEHYDRDFSDVFAIQTEIAQQIASQLQSKLSPAERAAIAERPTADPVSYAYYTEAKAISGDWEGWDKSLIRKVELLEKATQRDPNFALAYCALATTQMELFDVSVDSKHLELSKKAAETAVRVRPDLGETHLALARYYFWAGVFTGDYDRARDELTIARGKLPNNSEALLIAAKIDRHQNRWDSALANLQKANGLDPRNGEIAVWLGETYSETRRYSEWEQLIKKCAASGTFKAPWIQVNLAKIKLAQGDPMAAQSLLEQVPLEFSPNEIIWDTRFRAALYLRDYDAATRVIAATPAKFGVLIFGGGQPPESWADGLIARARGDEQKAQVVFAAAREKWDATWGNKPKDEGYVADLARLDAGLGRKEEAIREAQWVVDRVPIAKDSLNGPTWVANLALVYAWTGERDRALEQLEKVATIPGLGPTYGDLRFNPCWDSLRGDPRFDKIVTSAKAAGR